MQEKLFEEKKSDLTEDQLAALVRATSSDADNGTTLEKKDLMLTTQNSQTDDKSLFGESSTIGTPTNKK